MSEKREKSNKITIYLIKEDVKYDQVLKDHKYEILKQTKNSITYYLPTKIVRPKWLTSYFKDSRELNISNSNTKVISLHKLIINGQEKIFAIPFGNGKYLLNDDVIEDQFGLKILLNSVTKDGFRQLSTANYGGDHRTKNEQTPKKTNINEFGFDIHNDFLRKATAKSEEELFNKNTITGGELFSVSVPLTIDEIDDFLIACYKRYESDKYKKDFAWLDNIKEVKEKGTKQKLNEELVKQINLHNFENVWMAVPEIIEWEKIKDFRFREKQDGFNDIEIENFIDLFETKTIPNEQTLKTRKVYAMPLDSNEPLLEWSVYNCLIAEIELNGNVYCLNYGKWYKVNIDFVSKINDYYNELTLSTIVFPDNYNEKEDAYNKKLHESLANSTLLDKELVRISGMNKSSVEICDVLTQNNELIHVKKNGGSSYLSHLFNQAAVSGEMLLDSKVRKAVNEKIQKNIFDENFKSTDYKVILAIITKYSDERPKIPFFSKVSIKYSVEGLMRKGYKVEIKNIVNKKIN